MSIRFQLSAWYGGEKTEIAELLIPPKHRSEAKMFAHAILDALKDAASKPDHYVAVTVRGKQAPCD